jgi:hypothetical protein
MWDKTEKTGVTGIKSRVYKEDGDGQLIQANWCLEEKSVDCLEKGCNAHNLYGDKTGRGFMDEGEILGH